MSLMPLPQTPIKTFIDLKANGKTSRLRNHKGNMPSLPQNKCCSLCPAKFTRTTHLNRHLRSHTNERAHRCSSCNAEFTRSDLLTRHKKTCGDTRNANKSRRKSCQACVESKVRCNLEQPCSKCFVKGKECIFINDPGASRHRKSLAKRLSGSPSEEEASRCSLGLENLSSSSPSSTTSHISHDVDNIPHLIIPPYRLSPQLLSKTVFGLAGVSNVSDGSSKSACSSRSSPQLDCVDRRHKSSNAIHSNFDAMGLDSDIHNLFPSVPDPYIEDSFKFSPCVPWVHSEQDVSPWSESNQTCSAYGIGGSLDYSQPLQGVNCDQSFVSDLTPSSFSKSVYSKQPFCSYPSANLGVPISASSGSGNPTTEELNQYLYLFFTEFSTHIPLFHRPTWNMECTHPVLVKAMRACGALFTKTLTATNFIITTLTSSRDMMVLEFSKPSCTLKDHICLMLAVVLLQSIGLLHSRPEQRSSLRMYHDILVTMIRKTGLIEMIRSWPHPDLSDQASLESAWNDWARYETLKRTLALAYLQDCSYCIYYSTAPAFLGSEIDINLPCDDALWKAQTSAEWYKIQQAPSPYGMGLSRMLGTNMQFALAALKDRSTSAVPCTVNPFGSFILIHSILRDVFSVHNTRLTHGSSPHTCMIDRGGINCMNTMAIESSLHKWQKMWSSNPENVRSGESNNGLPFVCNAIPFYWLARLAEAAKQKGTIHVGPPASTNDIEDRYRLVKTWLMQISLCLPSGAQVLPG